jgi:hypothetical protein
MEGDIQRIHDDFIYNVLYKWETTLMNTFPENKPGVYCFTGRLSKSSPIQVLYIGSSISLGNRIKCHEIRTMLRSKYGVNPNIAYKYTRDFYVEEIEFIKTVNPILNKMTYEQYNMD